MPTLISFMAACAEFFGKKPNQSALDFKRELDALTEDDKAEIKAGLESLGYAIK